MFMWNISALLYGTPTKMPPWMTRSCGWMNTRSAECPMRYAATHMHSSSTTPRAWNRGESESLYLHATFEHLKPPLQISAGATGLVHINDSVKWGDACTSRRMSMVTSPRTCMRFQRCSVCQCRCNWRRRHGRSTCHWRRLTGQMRSHMCCMSLPCIPIV